MKKYECTVCGYVYEGDELPEDYECPLCGVGPICLRKFRSKPCAGGVPAHI